MELIHLREIKQILKPRDPKAHKNDFGHALIIAGGKGMFGAAVMASQACLRSGVGLITVHIPSRGEIILQTSIPEAMVSLDKQSDHLAELPELSKYNAIGIGPGLGISTETQTCLLELLKTFKKPIVLDADALNCLSLHPDWLRFVPENSILTPHIGEFKRLVGDWESDDEKIFILQNLAIKYKLNIVLKGSGTLIASSDGQLFQNTTGNAGLAKGGSGDVLTGMITAFLAQNYSPIDSAKLGVFLHGLAADLAVKTISEHSLLARDVIDYISDAFKAVSE